MHFELFSENVKCKLFGKNCLMLTGQCEYNDIIILLTIIIMLILDYLSTLLCLLIPEVTIY